MKNENKNIIEMTAFELDGLYNREIKRVDTLLKQHYDSNLKAQKNKCEFVQYLLASVDENLLITVEGCRGDGVIRDFCLTNSGSVVEGLINAVVNNLQEVEKNWDENDKDIKQGCMKWEIKASLGAKYLATASKAELTLLVNLDGISLIKKADVLGICKKKGNTLRLPARGTYGTDKHFIVNKLREIFAIGE